MGLSLQQMLSKRQIAAYNEVRNRGARGLICHAPFSSLNFEQNGNVTACCYNRSFQLGHVPEDALEDIWFGEKAEQLRTYIKANDLSGGCSACGEQIQAGNYRGTKAIYYDEYAQRNSVWQKLSALWKSNKQVQMPRVFEFELSNSCNLECTMCNGYFSSAIRKNREHLPPIKNHYSESFVEQLKPFIPYLSDAKFLGGEPFLIEIYYRIWDLVIEHKPDIKVHITTNGTVLNKKVKDYLERMRAGLILSVDTVDPEHYEQIRVNADYRQVMENLEWFRDYTRRKKTYLSIASCPIRSNRFDIPDLVRFCNERDIHLHLNTVWTPEDQSLRFLSAKDLGELLHFYESAQFDINNARQRSNVDHFKAFSGQIRAWKEEAEASSAMESVSEDWKKVFRQIQAAVEGAESPEAAFMKAEAAYYLAENPSVENLQQQLKELMQQVGADHFLQTYTAVLLSFSKYVTDQAEQEAFEQKLHEYAQILPQLERPDDMAEEIIRTGFLFQYRYFQQYPLEQIILLTRNRFKLKSAI
jgi:MoaA/NifB/PqqE/SkfB family radical SAM enzyme